MSSDHETPHRRQSESTPRALELGKNDSEPGIKPNSKLIAKEDADSKRNTSTRDNFTDRVKIIMSYRVGGLCSMCGCATYAPRDDDKDYTIGEAAHIVSASAKGPRHDSSMTSDQISDILNGIWLCSNCHTKIDSDEKAYSVEYLKRLREVAETRATLNLFLAQENLELNTVVSKLVKYDIQQCTERMHEFEELVAKLDYINFKDGYQPYVAEELLQFIEKNIDYLASHQSSSSMIIKHLKSITDCYETKDKTLSEKAFELEKQLMKKNKLGTEEELSHLLFNVHIDTPRI